MMSYNNDDQASVFVHGKLEIVACHAQGRSARQASLDLTLLAVCIQRSLVRTANVLGP
jgi:hypothetical protein